MLVSNPGDRACDYRYTIYKHINSLMLSNNTMPNYVHRFIWYVILPKCYYICKTNFEIVYRIYFKDVTLPI